MFINQNRIHYNQHIFLPVRNKFAYSCSIQIFVSWSDELLESIFCLLLVVEAFSLQKVVEKLEEMAVDWQKVRWQMKQNIIAQCIQLLKCCLCDLLLGIVMEKNWVLSVDQCLLVNCSFWCISSICCAYFSDVRDSESRSGSDRQQDTKQWPWPLFGTSLALGSAFYLLSPTTELVIAECSVKSTFHCTSQYDWEMVHCCRE